MTGSAAAKAIEAADALLDWLSTKPAHSPPSSDAARPEIERSGGEIAGVAAEPGSDPAVLSAPDQNLPFTDRPADPPQTLAQPVAGAQPAAQARPAARAQPAMRLAMPDWLHHRLSISGPSIDVEGFRQVAAGAGVIPWQLDLERMEEDYVHLLVAPAHRSLSVAGARIFARKLRDAVERRHDLAVSRVGHSRACPFDLHALIPVPVDILLLGPDAPRALAWLWEHWGTTEALRQVTEDGARGPVEAGAGQAEASPRRSLQLTFWSADWTPWRALEHLGARWPTLRFDLRPTYDPS